MWGQGGSGRKREKGDLDQNILYTFSIKIKGICDWVGDNCRREPTTVGLLNGHTVKLTTSGLWLYS